MARIIRERMSLQDHEADHPVRISSLAHNSAVIQSFFEARSSQVMDPTQPARRAHQQAPALGARTGGLTRDRAGFEVRDVHYTHYGRVCPIETREARTGLISSLSPTRR